MKEYEKAEHETIVKNETIEKLCRKLDRAMSEKESGFTSAKNSADPTSGAAQIIRASATIEAIQDTMKDLGFTVLLGNYKTIGVAHNATGELIFVYNR